MHEKEEEKTIKLVIYCIGTLALWWIAVNLLMRSNEKSSIKIVNDCIWNLQCVRLCTIDRHKWRWVDRFQLIFIYYNCMQIRRCQVDCTAENKTEKRCRTAQIGQIQLNKLNAIRSDWAEANVRRSRTQSWKLCTCLDAKPKQIGCDCCNRKYKRLFAYGIRYRTEFQYNVQRTWRTECVDNGTQLENSRQMHNYMRPNWRWMYLQCIVVLRFAADEPTLWPALVCFARACRVCHE